MARVHTYEITPISYPTAYMEVDQVRKAVSVQVIHCAVSGWFLFRHRPVSGPTTGIPVEIPYDPDKPLVCTVEHEDVLCRSSKGQDKHAPSSDFPPLLFSSGRM